ncbi:MAG: hypothetical protein ABEJ02_02960 [Candidatus Paceibacteria bacterium]
MPEDTVTLSQEQYRSLMEEIRNLQVKLGNLEEENEILRENQEELKNLVKGGSQPSKQLQIEQNGGPGCKEVALIMKEAREGRGITSSEAENLLEKQDVNRSRQTVLNILERIADEFPKYGVRKGSSTKPTALYFSDSV